ncbi:MAG: 50S ribosomal protein L9 [Candidatus Woesearchaeota archaeon]|jgi:large subunit ribosomal protein L9
MIEIVLRQDIKKLGYKGDIKMVKDGYFRNYLLPLDLAAKADKQAKIDAEVRKKKAVLRKEQIATNAKAIVEKLKDIVVNFTEKAAKNGHLYGSITEKEILEALKEQTKIELDKSNIKLTSHIKEIGEFEVEVVLNEEVSTKIKVVVKEEKKK